MVSAAPVGQVDSTVPMNGADIDHFIGMNQKVISMYARGQAVREIQRFFKFMYGTELPADRIIGIAQAAMAEVAAWQCRPLEPMYPLVFFEALPVKVLDVAGTSGSIAVIAFAVLPNGIRDVLGIWIEPGSGAERLSGVLNELRARGVTDVLIALGDGLKGSVPAMERIFPKTSVQPNILQLIRESLKYSNAQQRSALATTLRRIYTAETAANGRRKLNEFAGSRWGRQFPIIVDLWTQGWEGVTPFFTLPPEVRKVICKTSAIDGLCMQLRKVIRVRDHFIDEESARKLLWLAMRSGTHGMVKSTKDWKAAMQKFAATYGDRFVHV